VKKGITEDDAGGKEKEGQGSKSKNVGGGSGSRLFLQEKRGRRRGGNFSVIRRERKDPWQDERGVSVKNKACSNGVGFSDEGNGFRFLAGGKFARWEKKKITVSVDPRPQTRLHLYCVDEGV